MADLGLWLLAKLILAISTSPTESGRVGPVRNEYYLPLISVELGPLLASPNISPVLVCNPIDLSCRFVLHGSFIF